MIGYQDTLLPGGGYNWFYQCYIEGATDFIWGSGKVVLFEDCELHAPTGTRAVMQARVTEGNLGYVFDRCRFTVGAGYQSTLIYQYEPDNLTFLKCTFADIYAQSFVEKINRWFPINLLSPKVVRCMVVRMNRVPNSIILFLRR